MTTEDPLLQQFQNIQELQNQIEILNIQISKIHNKIQQKTISLKRIEAGIEALDSVSDNSTVYKQVSQMLLSYQKEELKNQLIKDKEAFDDLPKLQEVKNQFVSRLSSLNVQLLELHKQIQKASSNTVKTDSNSTQN